MAVTIRRNFPPLKDLTFSDRGLIREVLLLLRERIIRRTLSGRDESGAAFRRYSPTYKKQGTVNLQDTGQMLQGITPTRVQERRGELGFKGGGALQKATWHHVTGAGRSRVIRRFFGITREDEDTAFKRVEAFIARRLS